MTAPMQDIPVTGKNYSKNNGKRSPRDLYQTPSSMVHALFNLPEFRNVRGSIIWEPACGDGAMVEAIRLHGIRVDGTDIADGHDFLKTDFINYYPIIVTNPPFSQSLEFIKRCKVCAGSMFALLMDLEYLHGAARFREVYSVKDRWPLVSVNLFIRRPMLAPTVRVDGCYDTGMTTYAWYIWKRSTFARRSAPVIRWIDNDQYVLRGGKA